jgi:hypothetical protein
MARRRRPVLSPNQLPLFAGAPRAKLPPKRRPPDYIDRGFQRYHAAHPEVFVHWEKFCLWLFRDQKRRRYGTNAIIEEFRWWTTLPTHADPIEPYKLNNNYASRYARLVIAKHPELADLFELRPLKSERRRPMRPVWGRRTKNPPAPGNTESTAGPVDNGPSEPPSE